MKSLTVGIGSDFSTCHTTQKTLRAKHKKSVATWSNLCPWWWLFLPSHVKMGQRLARCSASHSLFFWRTQLTFPTLPCNQEQPRDCSSDGMWTEVWYATSRTSLWNCPTMCPSHSLPSSKIGCRDSSKGLQDPKGQQSLNGRIVDPWLPPVTLHYTWYLQVITAVNLDDQKVQTNTDIGDINFGEM